ncbi:MAG: hypothetical protein QM778_35210 [Myxococcales bacterium]
MTWIVSFELDSSVSPLQRTALYVLLRKDNGLCTIVKSGEKEHPVADTTLIGAAAGLASTAADVSGNLKSKMESSIGTIKATRIVGALLDGDALFAI